MRRISQLSKMSEYSSKRSFDENLVTAYCEFEVQNSKFNTEITAWTKFFGYAQHEHLKVNK